MVICPYEREILAGLRWRPGFSAEMASGATQGVCNQLRNVLFSQGFFLSISPKGRFVGVGRNRDPGATFEPDGAQGRRRSQGRVRRSQADLPCGAASRTVRKRAAAVLFHGFLSLGSAERYAYGEAVQRELTARQPRDTPSRKVAEAIRVLREAATLDGAPPSIKRFESLPSTPGVAMAPRGHGSARPPRHPDDGGRLRRRRSGRRRSRVRARAALV
jgi:hypothetical protein